MGAVVMPPDPAFYLKPQSVDDVVRYVVSKVLVALGIDREMPVEMQYGEGAV